MYPVFTTLPYISLFIFIPCFPHISKCKFLYIPYSPSIPYFPYSPYFPNILSYHMV